MSPLDAALAAIDAANARDPDSVERAPAALLYGRRMSETLQEFRPEASEPLRIACRGQHIERWLVPRTSYPGGRAGYLRWRSDLKQRHGERIAGIMADAGYQPEDCDRAAALVRKEGLKRDPEAQTLEDVACLVFIRWYFAEFAEGQPDDKLLDIVAKTGRKMSAEGREAAVAMGLPEPIATALQSRVGPK